MLEGNKTENSRNTYFYPDPDLHQEPYTDNIFVCDQFVWAPTSRKYCCKLEVVDVVWNGEENWIRSCRINDAGDALNEGKDDVYHEEDLFRESVVLWNKCPDINELERASQPSTKNPRS